MASISPSMQAVRELHALSRLIHPYCTGLCRGLNRLLTCAGDEIDAYQEEIIELSGTLEMTFSMFSDVVKRLFEWDSPDGGK